MYYVYILKSINYPDKYYTGYSTDLKKRIQKHNYGEVPSTTKYKPWEMHCYFAFPSQEKAIAFEKYLKTHSGRAFACKHF